MAAGVTSTSVTLRRDSLSMAVYNSGTTLAFIRWGYGAQTALNPDFPIPPGYLMILDKPGANTFAAITPAGTTTLYISQGSGE